MTIVPTYQGYKIALTGTNQKEKKKGKTKLETVSIAEPMQNRKHARETPNAVNTRREREWEGELKARREEEGN